MARLVHTVATNRFSTPGHTGRQAVLIALRIIGAGLIAAMAGIHLYLWSAADYRSIPTIGMLFLLNGVVAGVLTVALVATPTRFLAVVAGLSALFTAGTLGALLVSLTVGLFGFVESLAAPLVVPTIVVESAGVLFLAGLAVLAFVSRSAPKSSRSS